MLVHTILYVADQNKSTDFYSQVLGIRPRLHVPGMTEFKLSEKHILGLMPMKGIKQLLGDKLPDPEKGQGIPRAELYFHVENPELYYQRALEFGMKDLSPVQARNWGDKAGYVMDQDGHVIAFAASSAHPEKQDEIPQPVLTTQRLILSAYTESDLPDILEYASHPEVSRFVPWQSHKSLEDSKQFLNFATQTKKTTRGKLFYVFALRLKESGKAIGSIDFKNISASIGQMDYALGYNHWHQGYMSEAAMAVRDWAFEHLPEMLRLQAYCVPENRGSSRVMEKIGMSPEGIRRKAYMLKGVPVDLADYSILRDEKNV